MISKEQLQELATERSEPCVTISLQTHRSHPDNAKDEIQLKNFLADARERVLSEFDKKSVAPLLEKLEQVASKVDHNHNLDSLHVFLSNDTEEIIKSSGEVRHEGVHIADRFAVRPLIQSENRNENYLLMVLSQSGVTLYEALNDSIVGEITNEDFPFTENEHYITNSDEASDGKQVDNMVREYFNKVDKALVKVYHEKELPCVVICTEDNYSRLQQVADLPKVYLGYAPINYNSTAAHQIVKQAWEIVSDLQKQQRTTAIEQIKEAVSQGLVLTDLQEIYQAAIDGRGDLLIVHEDFSQAVQMKDERTFDLIDDVTQPHAIDDITSQIAWEVLSKKGNVIFTSQDEITELGKIVLKVRY
jgi:hypothetical protein